MVRHFIHRQVVRNGGVRRSSSFTYYITALQMWWGGYILFHHQSKYDFIDFLIAQSAVLFSLFSLGAAFQGISDRKETEKSAGRIFYLLDRKSAIDPLSDEGQKLD